MKNLIYRINFFSCLQQSSGSGNWAAATSTYTPQQQQWLQWQQQGPIMQTTQQHSSQQQVNFYIFSELTFNKTVKFFEALVFLRIVLNVAKKLSDTFILFHSERICKY